MQKVIPVNNKKVLHEFISFPRTLYSPKSPWVRPINKLLLDYLNPQINPFYENGTGQAFILKRKNRVIGRVLAHIYWRHHSLHNERVGYFGFFECINDLEAAKSLLDSAELFLRIHNCKGIRGPFNMTAAQEIGFINSGFDETPSVDMIYTPSWYPQLLREVGYSICHRMKTWRNEDISTLNPSKLEKGTNENLKSLGISIRSLDSSKKQSDMEHVRDIVNAAFLGNWGFVPITREEWAMQIEPLIPFLDTSIVMIAETQGVPIGVTLAVPDYNVVLRKTNGRLFHPSAIKLLRPSSIKSAVIILFAVRKQFQGLGVSRCLNSELIRVLQRTGYKSLSITWIGENNISSLFQAKSLGMNELHNTVMYEKKL